MPFLIAALLGVFGVGLVRRRPSLLWRILGSVLGVLELVLVASGVAGIGSGDSVHGTVHVVGIATSSP